jgi:hypothetical protein
MGQNTLFVGPRKRTTSAHALQGKKGHRVKNIVVTAPTNRILVLSETFPGHPHDKTGANEQGTFEPIPSEVQVHIDLGFLGGPTERPEGTFSPMSST